MRSVRGRWVLVAVAAVAFAVRLGSFAGWAAWAPLERELKLEPQRGLERMQSSVWMTWPWTVERARRLNGAWLRGAKPPEIAKGLTRLGNLQRRWFPTNPIGWLNLSRANLAAGREDTALVTIADAIRRDPTSPYLRRFKALVLLRMGLYDQALAELAQAEGLAPGYSMPKVDVLPGDDQWVRFEGLRRAAELYPRQRTRKLLALAEALRRTGKKEEAVATLAPVTRDPRVVIAEARWAVEDGTLARAVALSRSLIIRRMLPSDIRSRAYDVLARALAVEGNDAAAMQAANEAVRIAPDLPGPYLSLARIALGRGDADAALRYMHRAWGRAPADVRVLIQVAEIAQRAGDDADARLTLTRAAELAPEQPRVAARLVVFLLDRGDYMAAALELSEALDRSPDNPALLRLAGRLQAETSRARTRRQR